MGHRASTSSAAHRTLGLYGIKPEDYSGDQQMFDLIRITDRQQSTFNGDRVLAAILFSKPWTVVSGRGRPLLWSVKRWCHL
jgi:hypothetical protein